MWELEKDVYRTRDSSKSDLKNGEDKMSYGMPTVLDVHSFWVATWHELFMNEILTDKVHEEIDLRNKITSRRDDRSQKRFLTQKEDELFVQSLLLKFTESPEGKLLRKGDMLKNVATWISQEEKRGKSKGKKLQEKKKERLP